MPQRVRLRFTRVEEQTLCDWVPAFAGMTIALRE